MVIDMNFINWIKPSVAELYASHKNNGLPTFKIKTSHHKTRRIDFIFKTFKGDYGCIEFEHGDKFGDITIGATQLDDFFRMLKNGTKIIIKDKKIKIRYFLLATKYSIKGYLYKNDTRIIQTSGYSETEPLTQENNTIFQARRWMWRFCGREYELMTDTNPLGTSHFSVIGKNYEGQPQIELYGKTKIEVSKL